MSKKYYCVEIKEKEFHYRSIKFFVCKAKNKNKAIEKFYKEFDEKDEYEVKEVRPLDKIRHNDVIFCLK